MLDADTCYSALCARDARFDGVFFVGVRTTGIYCRPICSARTPARERCDFFRTVAEAEREGFRACFRCRPEVAPGPAAVDALPRLVRDALALIDAGFLNEHPVAALAARLGVTERHLRRATLAELGVAPVALAQSRRLALAKQLLQDTCLPLTEVAFASGFSSVRRFNALFHDRFGRPPSDVRRAHAAPDAAAGLLLRLDYRPPLDSAALLGFLAGRAIPGVEQVEAEAGGSVYRRTVRVGARTGWIAARFDEARGCVRTEVSLSLAGALMDVVARVRGLFDLDAQPAVIHACLQGDPLLAPLVHARPGLRVPGAFDGFETVMRALLGQQVSVRAATTLSGRLVERFGTPVATPHAGLGLLFPTAHTLAGASEDELAGIGLPRARARAIQAVAGAVAAGSVSLARGMAPAPPEGSREAAAASPESPIGRLLALPGIGDWTAQYVAMRVLGWPDAFPAGDLAVRKALGSVTAREARRLAEPWRPWRAYATMYLWNNLGSSLARGADV